MRQRDHFEGKGDFRMVSWLDYTAKRLYEITEDKTPGPESVFYEGAVVQLLRLISSTRVGKLLFDSLNRNLKYWIVPLDFIDNKTLVGGRLDWQITVRALALGWLTERFESDTVEFGRLA